jgi:hypothetical protein
MLYPIGMPNLKKITDPVSLGGNVIAIMRRQSNLAAAISRAAYDKARFYGTAYGGYVDFVQNPSNMDLITGIPISTRLQEAYTYAADVPEFAVESGVFYQDHIILHPVRIDLQFEVSNWVKTNTKKSLDDLENIYNSREPITLITEHKKIDNMFLVALNAENNMPEWGKLSYRASFQKINLVLLNKTSMSKDQVTATSNTLGPVITKSLEPSVDYGLKTPWTPLTNDKAGIFNGVLK